MRPLQPVLALYLLVFAVCVGLVAVPSCAGNQRQRTLRASLVSVNAARDGFVAWDMTHQQQIVEQSSSREEAETKFAVYRAKRESLVAAFEAVYRALAVAATQSDDSSLNAAMKATHGLLDAVKSTTGGP